MSKQSKKSKTLEIKFEYAVEDREEFWQSLWDIEDHIKLKQDIPFTTVNKLYGLLIKVVIEKENAIVDSGIEAINKAKLSCAKFDFKGFVYFTYVAHEIGNSTKSLSVPTRNRESYSLDGLIEKVVQEYSKQFIGSRTPSQDEIRLQICKRVIEYCKYYPIPEKKLSEYSRHIISAKIVEALGFMVIDSRSKKRASKDYFNAIQHHYKKAQLRDIF